MHILANVTDLLWDITIIFCAWAKKAKLAATAKSSSFFSCLQPEPSSSTSVTSNVITVTTTQGSAPFPFHQDAKVGSDLE